MSSDVGLRNMYFAGSQVYRFLLQLCLQFWVKWIKGHLYKHTFVAGVSWLMKLPWHCSLMVPMKKPMKRTPFSLSMCTGTEVKANYSFLSSVSQPMIEVLQHRIGNGTCNPFNPCPARYTVFAGGGGGGGGWKSHPPNWASNNYWNISRTLTKTPLHA